MGRAVGKGHPRDKPLPRWPGHGAGLVPAWALPKRAWTRRMDGRTWTATAQSSKAFMFQHQLIIQTSRSEKEDV